MTAETLEGLVFRKGDVSTLHARKATVASRVQQHEVVNQNTVWATGLFDHGWLLGGGWPKSALILRRIAKNNARLQYSEVHLQVGRDLVVDGSELSQGVYSRFFVNYQNPN